ncbi:hypothetical protein [Streptobacillus moniliformis]|uniref:hypothetical protein n=1 Tax=Streptobacillus moniliformis TaxID=34105 RepID=UPI0007E49FB8|nr:hypothetical protein [Streptobacillus moniliformis]
MKKAFLGVCALISVISFSDVTGYFKSNSEATIKSDNGGTKIEYDLSTKLDLGLYLDSKKETFIFAGGNLKGEGKAGSLKTPGYLGARFESKVTDDSNIILTGAYRIDNIDIKDIVKEHAQKAYRETGFDFIKDETILLSGIGYGKYDDIKYRLGVVYNSNNFKDKTHRLQSFVKAETKLEKADVSGELTYRLGNVKTNIYESNAIKEERKAFVEHGGTLKGEVNIKTDDRLVKDLVTEHKAYFDIGTMLPYKHNSDESQVIKTGLENKAVYKGVKNLELTGKLNYRAEIVSTYANNGTEQKGYMQHSPEAFVGIKYDNKKVMFSTENTDRVDVKHELKAGLALKDDMLNNFFKTDNKLEIKPSELITLRAKVFDILKSEKLKNSAEHKNSFLGGGLGLTLNPKSDKVKFEHKSDVVYKLENLDVKSLKNVDIDDHELFLWTTNKLTVDVNEKIKLEGNLNSYNYLLLGDEENIAIDNFTELNGKVSYKQENVDFSQMLSARYAYGDADVDDNRHYYMVESDTKLGYKVNSILEINSGLNLEFNASNLKEQNRALKMYVESQGLHEDKFKTLGQYTDDVKYDDKKLINRINDEVKSYGNDYYDIVVKPELGVTMKFLENKLTVKPNVSTRLLFTAGLQGFKFNRFNTKGTLKIEYIW